MVCSQLKIKYYDDFILTNFNTLRIKAKASQLWLPDNYGEMISLLKQFKNDNPIVIGNGSNILFSSQKIEEPIIYTGHIKSTLALGNTIEAEAGIKTQTLSKLAYDKGLSGFEFLIGIPATLGGAIYMNAGAHKQTISDYLVSAKVYDCKNNKILNLTKDELGFSYRHSILKEKPYILLSAKFELEKKDKTEIKARMDENLIFRKNRQPNLALPNAGSVFKNPPNSELSAGALIDKCGLRGFKMGECEVYENHCNFIINKGSATSVDYTNIVFEIYTKVKEKFGIELTPEIVYIGKMTKDEEEKWKILKK
ncbi:MAG: UDP-N-acetylmuramate dehydrogenase [Candidatus Gastranaerophilales bacterium]|nr:UDP-N-acetylmuramate dehydrogenase [Candidatus Gastranaerophilales bacterium]